MMAAFELFVAGRYLRARRKEKVISVITAISVIGVAAGVTALIISLALNNGFQNTLQRNMLAATAHVNILAKDPGKGIAEWRPLIQRFKMLPHVVAVTPVLYDEVLLTGARGHKEITLKGIDPRGELATSETLRHLKSGSLSELQNDAGLPGIVVGSKLGQDAGLILNSTAKLLDPEGNLTPSGPGPHVMRFRVAGIFETDFFDVDDRWAYASLASVQKLESIGDVVNSIEVKLDNPDRAPQAAIDLIRAAGPQYSSLTWEEQNQQLFHALKLERVVTAITIGLIVLVGALNIFITLTMVVLTKYKDVAVLMSMGARRRQIRRIFVLQGAMIGALGVVIGLILGYTFCYFAGTYRLIPLDETVYALSYVPFDPNPWDGVWITCATLAISLLATIYPARNAIRITPVEVLRYE
ncbi:MAG TPA: ABC transporter permease [Bryobacteraceae bacterium]|nr:ABC transporter permease [Bryobacteraceae bacterium]